MYLGKKKYNRKSGFFGHSGGGGGWGEILQFGGGLNFTLIFIYVTTALFHII